MFDPILVSALMKERELEVRRAAVMRDLKPAQGVKPKKSPMRTALSLSVAFAAGWLAASIL